MADPQSPFKSPEQKRLLKKLEQAFKLRKQKLNKKALVLVEEVWESGIRLEPLDRLRAELLLEFEHWEQAMEPLKRLQNQNPNDPWVYVRMANALAGLELPDQQQEVLNVGLHHMPHDPTLLASIMQFRPLTDSEFGMLEALFPRMKKGEQKAHGAVSLARIYHQRGQHEAAFQLLKTETGVLSERPDGLEPEKFLNHLRNAKAQDKLAPALARGAEVGNADPLEVLIIGFSRSGKSLVESLLALHPTIRAGGEMTHLGPSIKSALQSAGYKDFLAYLREADEDTLRQHAKWYRNRLLATDSDKLVTDTMPSNIIGLPVMAVWAPKTPVIMVRRSLNDLALSCFFSYYTRNHGYSYDLKRLGRMIAAYEQLRDLLAEEIPNPVLTVDYEDLVQDTEATARRIYEFMGLEWQPDYLDGLQTNQSLASNLDPFISHDKPMPMRDDFVGWSEPYRDWLEPMRRAYRQQIRGQRPVSGVQGSAHIKQL